MLFGQSRDTGSRGLPNRVISAHSAWDLLAVPHLSDACVDLYALALVAFRLGKPLGFNMPTWRTKCTRLIRVVSARSDIPSAPSGARGS